MKRFESREWRDSMRLRVDYNNMMQEFVGMRGIGAAMLAEQRPQYKAAALRMEEKRGEMKWRQLPFNQSEVVHQILETAAWVRRNCDAFVVLGIGGSALGPIAVQQALSHLRYNDPARTVFNVITKSGSTSETMSQLLWATDFLKNAVGDAWREHVIATTDAEKGNLIKIAKENDLTTFFVPDGVGGRFSELCPVGLLAAAVCGIDIEELLAGAAYMDSLCSEQDALKNPACILAALEVLAMKQGCNISVLMPYADSLRFMSDWYAQLWAESLGKRYACSGREIYAGQTPVKALGVTDQHSQVQLYTEGPFDKVITFLGVDRYRAEIPIPHAYDYIPDVAFLSGHTFNELIKAEQAATEYAVCKSGHMSKTITLPEVNAFTIGELICLFELQTAFAGELLGLNAFDQPGVEEGKKATYALLGKPGFAAKKAELDAMPARDMRYQV